MQQRLTSCRKSLISCLVPKYVLLYISSLLTPATFSREYRAATTSELHTAMYCQHIQTCEQLRERVHVVFLAVAAHFADQSLHVLEVIVGRLRLALPGFAILEAIQLARRLHERAKIVRLAKSSLGSAVPTTRRAELLVRKDAEPQQEVERHLQCQNDLGAKKKKSRDDSRGAQTSSNAHSK